jgi:DNA replication and repair protein RecF
VQLTYLDSLKDAWDHASPDVESLTAAFRRRIGDVRQKELWNGVSLVGPQRDDLRVQLAGRDVAEHASRGQQRTIILAMKLAETELLGEEGSPRPVVLLDDIFSELDPERSERALALLLERGQVLVTMADMGMIPAARRRGVPVWHVGEGALTLAPRVA